MRRKVVSLLLCGVIACSMLVGCGDKTKSADGGDTKVSQSIENVETPTESVESSTENIEPSIYTELTPGESTLKDTKRYLTSVTANMEDSSVTHILSWAYGKFLLGMEGILFLDFEEVPEAAKDDYVLEPYGLKILYSDADTSKQMADAIMEYFDKLYIRGVYLDDEYRRPAYLCKDNSDFAVLIVIDNTYTDDRGYHFFIDMVEAPYMEYEEENFYWFDDKGKPYQAEYWKAEGYTESPYANIEDANIDLYEVY